MKIVIIHVYRTNLIQFNSIQEAREFPWAPRSNWGTPSRSHPDQGFSAYHSLVLTSNILKNFLRTIIWTKDGIRNRHVYLELLFFRGKTHMWWGKYLMLPC